MLVRETIARHVGGDASAPARSLSGAAPGTSAPGTLAPSHLRTFAPSEHASHFLFMVPTGSDADGPCVIEPAVPCTHCGYCRSYGH